jgi:hypothetical protein
MNHIDKAIKQLRAAQDSPKTIVGICTYDQQKPLNGTSKGAILEVVREMWSEIACKAQDKLTKQLKESAKKQMRDAQEILQRYN